MIAFIMSVFDCTCVSKGWAKSNGVTVGGRINWKSAQVYQREVNWECIFWKHTNFCDSHDIYDSMLHVKNIVSAILAQFYPKN